MASRDLIAQTELRLLNKTTDQTPDKIKMKFSVGRAVCLPVL